MVETLILVDENDKFLGYAPREECHFGEGKKHRAFVTLLLDSHNQVLLQRRKHRLFDNMWDLTAVSHLLHLDDHDETEQEASDRALKKEMSIGHVQVEDLGSFNYFSQQDQNCENENCSVLVGKYDGAFTPNSNEVYKVKKLHLEEFLTDMKTNPLSYTPWAVLSSNILQKHFQIQSE